LPDSFGVWLVSTTTTGGSSPAPTVRNEATNCSINPASRSQLSMSGTTRPPPAADMMRPHQSAPYFSASTAFISALARLT
jgi:hypothetical protein